MLSLKGHMQLCLQKFLIEFRFSGNENQNTRNYSACFLTCSPYFRGRLELQEESPAPAVPAETRSSDTGHLFRLSLCPLKPLSGPAPPAQTIALLQAGRPCWARAKGSQGQSNRGVLSLVCAFRETQSCPSSTWALPWLLPCAQGNGQNLPFKALIKLVADKTPFWQGTTVQQTGSATQWSGAWRTLSGWWIVTHRFSVGWRGERKERETERNKNPADQCLLPLFIQCPQPGTPRDFPDDLIFVLTHKC